MSNVRELMRQERLRRLAEKSSSATDQTLATNTNKTPAIHSPSKSSTNQTSSSKTSSASTTYQTSYSSATSTSKLPPMPTVDTSTDTPQLTTSTPSSKDPILEDSKRLEVPARIEPTEFVWELPNPIHLMRKNSRHTNTNSVHTPTEDLPSKPTKDTVDSNGTSELQQQCIKPEASTDKPSVSHLLDKYLPTDFFDEGVEMTIRPTHYTDNGDPELPNNDGDEIPKLTNSTDENEWEYEVIEPNIDGFHDEENDSYREPADFPIPETPELTPTESTPQPTSPITHTQVVEDPNPVAPLGKIDEVDELYLYQTLDTAYHSNLENEPKETEVHSEKTSQIPEGFFDDEDADAAARGLEGPKKRKKREIEKEMKKFSTLADVQMIKVNISQELSDMQTYEINKQEDLTTQSNLKQKLETLKSRKSKKIYKSDEKKPLDIYHTPFQTTSYKHTHRDIGGDTHTHTVGDIDEDDIDFWRSKTFI